MTHENYKLIRNAMNDCYNVFYAKWAQKSLNEPLSDKDWITIVSETKIIVKRYENTICASLAMKLLLELIELLERR